MSSPTKRQRHAIYKKALKMFDLNPAGLCLVLSDADGKWAKNWRDVHGFFPEFVEQYNPEGSRGCYGLPHNEWEDLTHKQAYARRRRALLRCIELTEP